MALKSSIKNIAKAVLQKTDNQDALYQMVLPYKIKNKYVAGGVAGIAGITIANSAYKGNVKGKMGETTVGELSGITPSGQQTLSPLIKEVQEGRYNTNNIENNFSNHGADGDIVFALHNMR